MRAHSSYQKIMSFGALRVSLAVSLVAAILAGAALAGPLEDANAAYDRGDYATALQLIRPLADQGDVRAQSILGLMYENGRGVPQDYAEAVKWYRKAADQGFAHAQYFLGIMYNGGYGVPQDSVEAYKWFDLAASLFPASETKRRETAVKNRDAAAAKMTTAQIAEAQNLAREWKASEQQTTEAGMITPPAPDAPAPQTPALRRSIVRLSGVDVVYPRAAIRAGISEGKVVARMMIDEKGNVYEVIIVSAEPLGYFDQVVIDTLKEWKFRAEGKKVIAEIVLNFELK